MGSIPLPVGSIVPAGVRPVPLVVDMDGTLLLVETQDEMIRALAHRPIARTIALIVRAVRGKAAFKRFLLWSTRMSADSMPRRPSLVAWLEEEAAAGATVVLASGSPVAFVEAIAARHRGLFTEIIGTHHRVNLTGQAKALRLVAEFGVEGFDYVGNSRADLAVWAVARNAIVCGGSSELWNEAARLVTMERAFD